MGLRQYMSDDASVDGHFVATASMQGRADVLRFLLGPTPCLACDASFPVPWLARPGFSLPTCEGFPLEPPLLLGPWGSLGAAPVFSGDPWSLLVEDVTGEWVAASEPDAWLPREGLRYAALSLETMQVERALWATPAGLSPFAVQPGPCPFCDLPPSLAARGRAPAAPEAVAVLSARRELLWVLRRAGTEGSTEVSVLHLRTGAWRSLDVPEDIALGRVLGAVYDAVLDSLLVLDEVPGRRGRGARRVRLLRLEPLGGEGEVLWTAPRTGATRRFALAADPSGALWVASSGETAGPSVQHLAVSDTTVAAEIQPGGFILVFEGGAMRQLGGALDPVVRAIPQNVHVVGTQVLWEDWDATVRVASGSISQAAAPFIDVDAVDVKSFRADGVDLAWMQAYDRQPDGSYARVELWSSPHAPDPGSLSPRLVREMPVRTQARLGVGVYAILRPDPRRHIELYDLADGRHRVYMPPETTGVLELPLYITSSEMLLIIGRPGGSALWRVDITRLPYDGG